MCYYVLDRFEEDFAVLENLKNTQTINIKRNLLLSNLKEGDVILKTDMGWILDEEKTKERKNKIDSKLNSLWKR